MPSLLIVSDSYWAGYPTGYGPRAYVAKGLGPDWTYVGSQATRWTPGKGYTNDGLYRHEAHGGWSTASFLAPDPEGSGMTRIARYVRDAVPDVVWVSLGINDSADKSLSPTQFLARMNRLVLEASAKMSPGSKLYVSTIAGAVPGSGSRIDLFNRELASGALASPAILVDGARGFNREIAAKKGVASVMIDGHPNARGSALLANDMLSALGGTTQPVPGDSGEAPPDSDAPPTPTANIGSKPGPFAWISNADGTTVVVDATGRSWLPLQSPAEMEGILAAIKALGDDAKVFVKYEAPNGLPPNWIGAVAWAESRMQPNVVAPDGGVGLMQITSPSLKAGRTDDELKDPDLNVRIGAEFLGSIVKMIGARLPEVASVYNCGGRPGGGGAKPATTYSGTTTPTPWGLCSAIHYIDRVVSAANTLSTGASTTNDLPGGGGGGAPPRRGAEDDGSAGLVAAAIAGVVAGIAALS